MKQSTIFVRGEGNRWYHRNLHKKREPDPVMAAIKSCGLKPHTVLEIGCGNGWRLQNIRRDLGAVCYGIDPAKDAVNDAPQDIAKTGIKCWRGTADKLVGVKDHSIDMVIYGFCLYVCDREDLFRIVAESDRVLRDDGTIVLHDFISTHPYSRDYEHQDGVKSYKCDNGLLWLGNPSYRSIYKKIQGTESEQPKSRDDQVVVQIIRKDAAHAYPNLSPEMDNSSDVVSRPAMSDRFIVHDEGRG